MYNFYFSFDEIDKIKKNSIFTKKFYMYNKKIVYTLLWLIYFPILNITKNNNNNNNKKKKKKIII